MSLDFFLLFTTKCEKRETKERMITHEKARLDDLKIPTPSKWQTKLKLIKGFPTKIRSRPLPGKTWSRDEAER